MRQLLLPVALLAGACGGGAPSPEPISSSPEAVRAFMRAAADSNLSRMAQLWGTASGPASETHPKNLDKILVVLQAYLRGDSTRIVSDVAIPGDDNRRKVSMALYRGTCMKQIPVTTIRLGNNRGWIVNSVDVSFAGNPARPCEPGGDASHR
jgi:hypothetical protein